MIAFAATSTPSTAMNLLVNCRPDRLANTTARQSSTSSTNTSGASAACAIMPSAGTAGRKNG